MFVNQAAEDQTSLQANDLVILQKPTRNIYSEVLITSIRLINDWLIL